MNYKKAGVDIEASGRIKGFIGKLAEGTYSERVIKGIGPFASLFKLEGYKKPVLVSSVDGVGTKLKIADALSRLDVVGVDIVYHCVNDILTCGAKPLFFLDYIAMDKLSPDKVLMIVDGITRACLDLNLPLVGGELAEMPGIYRKGNFDLVGFIVGVCEEGEILPRDIKAGDKIIGLPSSGLHTNGFSLVRKIFGERREELSVFIPELGGNLADELLKTHRCYFKELYPKLAKIKGMAHITGGGIEGNLRRILPPGLSAYIDARAWEIPPIFRLIEERGKVPREEMFRVFNMGIGMIVIGDIEGMEIGEVRKGEGVFIDF